MQPTPYVRAWDPRTSAAPRFAGVLALLCGSLTAQTVTSISPTDAWQVTDVVIAGTGFDAASQVLVDGVPETIFSLTPTQIVVRPDLAEPGFADVTVTSSTGSVTVPGGLALRPTMTFEGGPIGMSVDIELDNGAPGLFAWIFDSAALAAPIDLGPTVYSVLQLNPFTFVGLPGSPGLLSPEGKAELSVPVPLMASLVGEDVFGQGVAEIADPFAFSFTNLAQVTIAEALPFEVVSISVPPGAVWEVNRPIEFVFTQPVDFSSIAANTVVIQTLAGVPAQGQLSLAAPDTVVFQPTCPLQDDFLDAGFQPGGVTYRIEVRGQDGGAPIVLAANGQELGSSVIQLFTTPVGLEPAALFFDTAAGPPAPVLRTVGSSDPNASFLELGEDPGNAIYFEVDPSSGAIAQPSGVPLNLYSDVGSHVAFVLEIDQAVNPSSSNVDPSRVFLERRFLPNGEWEPFLTSVELVSNCTATGATLRLEPLGILPQGSQVRAVIAESFEDIVGETNLVALDGFAVVETLTPFDPTFVAATDLADELFESFDVGGDQPGSLEDTAAVFAVEPAEWGGGVLQASLSFEGNGGPGGDFDLLVPGGATLVLDTTAATVFGGPQALQGVNGVSQSVVGGVLQVRNLRIESGGLLRAQGPNPLVILATGDVEIFGSLSVDGFPAQDVATFDTGDVPEPGASGACGGGRGGTGSVVTTTSTPRGGDGFGAFDAPGWWRKPATTATRTRPPRSRSPSRPRAGHRLRSRSPTPRMTTTSSGGFWIRVLGA